MKKIVLIAFLIYFSLHGKAQFVNAFAVTGGVSYSNQNFIYSEPSITDKKKYVLGYNAGLFVEFFSHDRIRWVTEFQYNQKGSVDNESSGNYSNQLQYGCWNNYLKLRYEMYSIIPYILAGPRLEYTIAQNTSSPDIAGNFSTWHVSAAVGAGIEFVSFSNATFLIESFYNPDITNAYNISPLSIYNKNFELRIGLKYSLQGRNSCSMPRG